jgi:hypothetical protein
MALRRAVPPLATLSLTQLFLGAHIETLSVPVMRLASPDCTSVGVIARDAATTPTDLLKSPLAIRDAIILREILGPTRGLRALELIGS